MDRPRRGGIAVAGAVAFFLIVQFGALVLAGPFEAAGYRSVENPQNPANSAIYVGIVLVATAVMLLVMRLGRTLLLRAFLVLTSGLIAVYVFSVTLPPLVVGGVDVSPWIGGALLALALAVHPEWWVIDGAGLIMGMGAAALFGISFGILPAILLLLALAVYDAISVYGTEHMLTLASGVMELRVPVVIVLPTTAGYSFIEDAADMADSVGDGQSSRSAESSGTEGTAGEDESGGTDESASDASTRDAIFIGLGDAVMPSILVASASVFLETPTLFGVEVAPLGAIAGTTVGLLVLLWMVLKGRPHAGLPLLNGGSIAGYLLGALASGISLLGALDLEGLL
ncbi:MAG: presenilin family intramembrane aspartyl protease PSH [Halanaeroarchaeum sp.]